MSSDREAMFQKMVRDFPDSPMGHFSLGKYYLEANRWQEAAACFETATRLQPDYAAALLALGDAFTAAGERAKATSALERAKQVALAQGHKGLAEEIDQRLLELRR